MCSFSRPEAASVRFARLGGGPSIFIDFGEPVESSQRRNGPLLEREEGLSSNEKMSGADHLARKFAEIISGAAWLPIILHLRIATLPSPPFVKTHAYDHGHVKQHMVMKIPGCHG